MKREPGTTVVLVCPQTFGDSVAYTKFQEDFLMAMSARLEFGALDSTKDNAAVEALVLASTRLDLLTKYDLRKMKAIMKTELAEFEVDFAKVDASMESTRESYTRHAEER